MQKQLNLYDPSGRCIVFLWLIAVSLYLSHNDIISIYETVQLPIMQ